ncbi:hypothetical protein A3C98_00560 [Candidatus Roizmanbacteria bacterium RIFCSPHIGHO2_02_FULL_37_15]|uniref:DUF5667 domain-containing protein n=1 Tax=Candidatus Roizmanbacteria bacterium RIFCSPLOWO2_01_FULL_37_16 TaxID=1802058 RepID=A0A1F7INL3_9BACT|nr:MAG: hypothetical protein A2859_01320 [Candidatus Roizmanbacteria bacterium RIFCSPHIGHO2_01_FULL_37_16b]OGK22771.1 MAG: hypothetical protein A3C98_00560 [Candidatus Roizmanbacteria bacterium RIFCSPHIGHO2_02_FULL_37_15]OGK33499.1 MAG: hypothetical protein A3F57_04295 [Candidatus Roizmanbacteria bacterium RIFCSPHIGHO2_12_FULL_36_11]OGK44911.1 MAG: hypothetical protein A3B40_00070 [Candidatus Roizmanbacteria bacterium RIFCSPLOWO2_01_FULL_37_16]
MLKKVIVFFFYLFFFLLIPPRFNFLQSQPVNLIQEKVEYNLPYPGILPDHPLFFIKEVRDKILELTTRNNLKKAELYLLFSDKRVGMAMSLAKNGKDKQAVKAFLQAEQYFLKIPSLMETSKKQGVSASSDLIQRLKLSNAKHKETGEGFLKDLPQGQNEGVNDALDLNQQIKRKIEKL